MIQPKKIESTFFNMVLVLLVVTVISSASLASVFGLTKEKIGQAQKAKELNAIADVVLPEFNNSPDSDVFEVKLDDGANIKFYPAKKDGETTSYAIKTYTNRGFSGLIEIMVGMLPDGTINKFSVVSQKETPGLGTLIEKPKFKNQFNKVNPASFSLKVKKDGGDVDAVTAATISSRAVCHALKRAVEAYNKKEGSK